jgi:hypothetical protein
MHYIETPQEKEMRAREQANLDEDRKEKKKDFDRWQEKFAVDFAKGMDCIYQLVSQTIITDLDRTLEQLTPVTRDAEIQFFTTIFRRLEDKWGPTSKKDSFTHSKATIAVGTPTSSASTPSWRHSQKPPSETPPTTPCLSRYPTALTSHDLTPIPQMLNIAPTSQPTPSLNSPGNNNIPPTNP